MTTQPKTTTTDSGIPVESQENSLTVGPNGPLLLIDHYLIEQMANSTGSAFRSDSLTPREAARSAISR